MRPAQFDRIVDDALDDLPAWVVDAVENLHVVVENRPTTDQDPDGRGILGIYEGVSLAERGNEYSGFLPDRIVIFREPHLALGLSRSELRREIRRTVLHEVAHHLGIGDQRLEELGWD